jgi:aminoglycoside 6'-N-acetyltransferase
MSDAPRHITLQVSGKPTLVLRAATHADIPTLLRWDADPTVIASGSDNPDAVTAWGEDNDWAENIDLYERDVWEYWVAELNGRPIGCMQLCDPHLEPTHYWGEIEPNLRALDIWIGEPDARGQGHGEAMMRLGIVAAFEDPAVNAIIIDPLASNTRAHTFYQRLGFRPMHRQMFGEDDCLVHTLTREEWSARSVHAPKTSK